MWLHDHPACLQSLGRCAAGFRAEQTESALDDSGYFAANGAPAITPRPVPSPTPTPPKLNPGVAPAPISAGPQYSPAQLDFGSLWDGQSAKRTLTLTPPIGGIVTLSLPQNGLFWLAEYRELGPLGGASKNSPMGPLTPSIQRQLKARTTYQFGQVPPGDVQWNVDAGSAIQIDLVFQPQINGLAPSGPISILVQLKSPGPMKPWSVWIPACGVFEKKPSALPSPPSTFPPSGPKTCPQY